MIFDLQTMFSDAQDMAGVAATTVSTNVIDLGAQGTPQHASAVFKADLGKGTSVPIRIQMTEAAAGGAAIAVQVQVSTDEAFTSPIVVASTAAIADAALVQGYVFSLDEVPLRTNERYLRLAYVKTGTHTAGKITAGITLGNDEWYS